MTPKEVIEKAAAAWNEQDRADWMTLCSSDADLADAGSGLKAWAETWDELHEAFPDSRFKVLQTVQEGEYIAFVMRFTGTHTGTHRTSDRMLAPTGVLAPTGKHVEFDVGQFGQVQGGQVISLRGFGVVEGFSVLGQVPAWA